MVERGDIAQLLILVKANFRSRISNGRSTFNTSEANSPSTSGCEFHLPPSVRGILPLFHRATEK